MREVMEKAKDM